MVETWHRVVAGESSEVLDGRSACGRRRRRVPRHARVETTVGDEYVNGVDIIRCDETGRTAESRVMIRSLQTFDAIHEQMRAMLASMQPPLHPDER